MNSEFGKADNELVKEVQNTFDPTPNRGKGYGLAPIGHTVTVVSAEPVPISYKIQVSMKSGHDVSEIKAKIEKQSPISCLIDVRNGLHKKRTSMYLFVPQS